MNNLNDLTNLDAEQVKELVTLARRLDSNPEPRALEGKVLALLFLSPSLRTLASFQAAMTRLGGGTFVISPDMSIHGLESRSGIVMDGIAAEHIREAVPVIASYGDIIGIRAFARRQNLDDDLSDREFAELVSLVDTPYINMESAIYHPCQNLADWKTLDDMGIPENNGKLVLSWTWHPQALPLAVPSSTIQFTAMRGMDITILRPDGYQLPDATLKHARQLAESSGGSICESDDRAQAMEGCNVLYATSWSSPQYYGNSLAEDDFKGDLRNWCVDESWFDTAATDCRFMHCLPVRRGVTVLDSILDGPRSVVIQESRNRMLVQMAVLHRMLTK